MRWILATVISVLLVGPAQSQGVEGDPDVVAAKAALDSVIIAKKAELREAAVAEVDSLAPTPFAGAAGVDVLPSPRDEMYVTISIPTDKTGFEARYFSGVIRVLLTEFSGTVLDKSKPGDVHVHKDRAVVLLKQLEGDLTPEGE